MFSGIGTWFFALWETIKTSLEAAGVALIALLPSSPFEALNNTAVGQYMAWLNWIVPLQQMTAILQAWCAAILIYYIYVVILRWIKAVQ